MRLDCSRVHLAPCTRHQNGGANKKITSDDIPKLRKLLRSDSTITEIGLEFGVDRATIHAFVNKHRLCDLKLRRKIISTSRLESIAD